jgi:hypothetical protein
MENGDARHRRQSGFYCWEAAEAYERRGGQFIIAARKTAPLVEALKAAVWKSSPRTDAEAQCEFRYQPRGWGRAYRLVAVRCVKKKTPAPGEAEQYQLFETTDYSYRAFVTNLEEAVDLLVWLYRQRAGAENLIKEANNDAGLAAYPSRRWAMNANHFQLAMLAYNLNCWLLLFNREEKAPHGGTSAYDVGHGAAAVSVSGCQDLAAGAGWESVTAITTPSNAFSGG